MTAWQPSTAASSPSPEITFTPADRETVTPSCPSRSRTPRTARPTRPLPPMTAILIDPSLHLSGGRKTPIGGPPELRHAPVERLAEQLRLVCGALKHRHVGVEPAGDGIAHGDEGMAADVAGRRGHGVPGAARHQYREARCLERPERDLGLVRRALADGAAHRPAGGVVQPRGRAEVEAPRIQKAAQVV